MLRGAAWHFRCVRPVPRVADCRDWSCLFPLVSRVPVAYQRIATTFIPPRSHSFPSIPAGSLDAVRTIYTSCIGEIHELAEGYRASWAQPGLKLHYTASRGYHLVLPLAAESSLPGDAVQAVRSKTSIAFSTHDLLSLNDRVSESLFNVYVLTHQVRNAASSLREATGWPTNDSLR